MLVLIALDIVVVTMIASITCNRIQSGWTRNPKRKVHWIKIIMVNCHVGNIQLYGFSLCPSCNGADAPLDVWLSALSVCLCVCV